MIASFFLMRRHTKAADIQLANALLDLKTAQTDYPMQAERRAAFVAEIQRRNAEADTHEWQTPSIKQQLDDAGFGSQGPM